MKYPPGRRPSLRLPATAPLAEILRSDCSRRSFLGFSVSAASAALFGCSSASSHTVATTIADAGSDGTSGDGGTEAGALALAPFGIWEKLRTAVRASPDHLGAAADRLVLAKDPNAIFEFVRDQIVAYPPTAVDGAVTETRWGVRGTLRGGAGTPREKVELLADLYRRAGFDATIVSGTASDTDPLNSVATRVYLRPITRTFAPDVDDKTLADYATEMAKVADVPTTAPIDGDDTERAALIAAVSAVVPKDTAAQMGAYDATLGTAGIGLVPLVAVTVAGTTRYGNPLFAEARFGDSMTSDTPSAAVAATLSPTVVVELSISTTTAPTTRVSVAKGTYSADQLAGRQILAQFAPAAPASALATRRLDDLHSFKPVLSVRGRDVDPDADPAFVVIGPQVTRRGDIVETAADGTVTVNGRRLFAPSAVNPKAVTSVASLALEVRAGAFPTVRLVVSALDASSKPVLGLPASAFPVTEGGAPMGVLLTATPSDTVRVCLVFDLDDPLGTGEDPLELAKQLTTAVTAAYPGAVILTGADGTYVERTDPAAVAAAVGGDPDDAWAVLADAAQQAPTIVVVVSDFWGFTDAADPLSSPKGAYRALVAAGPPVVAISTDVPPAPSNPAVEALATLTAGVSVPSGSIATSVKAVLDLLAKQKAGGTYSLTYQAPLGGPPQRDVQVTVNQVSATGSYTAPAASKLVEQSALAGIYLTVSLGDATVTRVLGGYRPSNPPDPGVPIAQSVLDEVRDALFGVSLLSFEAGAPSPSTSLDDLLSIKLATEPLSDAIAANDSSRIQDNVATLRTFVPAELTALQCAPAPSTVTSSTYEDGLRIVHYSHQPRLGVGHVKRVDILPLAGWGTVSADAMVSFRDTLARTARVAIVEGHTFPTSTLTALAGKKLTLLPIGGVDPTILPAYAPDVLTSALQVLGGYDEYFRLLPDGATFVGFWAVNPRTGTLIGVLPDGTGGASQSTECTQANATSDAFTVLGLIAGLAGMGALGPLFFLGQRVAEIALLSAAILDGQDGMVPGSPDAAINGLAASAACQAAKLAVTSVAPAAGNTVGRLVNGYDRANSLVSLSHVSGASYNCPNALAGVGCQ